MKYIVTVFCLAVTIYGVKSDTAKLTNEMKDFDECLKESNIKPEFVEEMKKHKDPKLRCIMSCVMTKQGMLKNGEFNKESLKKDILSDFDDLTEKDATDIINSCVSLATHVSDVCDKANVIAACLHEELEK